MAICIVEIVYFKANLTKRFAFFCTLFVVRFVLSVGILCGKKVKSCCMNYLEKLQKLYQSQDDYLQRDIFCGVNLHVVSLDTMSDSKKVCDFVLQPLAFLKNAETLDNVFSTLLLGANAKKEPNFDALVQDFFNGYTLVFAENEEGCVAVDTRTSLSRAIVEPPTSMVMRGPREGFIEDVKANVTLLRKRLKSPDFKTINLNVGNYTNTAVCVCYIQGVADQKLVDMAVQKLQSISIDGILDSSYLARYLDSDKTFLFRRIGTTEKPDVAVGKMLEGRLAVVVDGSPMVLTLPYLFIEDLQSLGDYYENTFVVGLRRVLRLLSVLASVLLPSLYVCLQMYNYQIIPLKFLITILNATQSIPFTPLTEMLIVIILFDILREANLRMPSAVGITLSLVGAIILGDAAVNAGLMGAPAVMIGALSGIGLFAMPDNTLVLSLLRIAITFLSGLMGMMGVMLSLLVLMLYLASLENYKTPFLAPYAPNIPNDRQDAMSQKPLQKQKLRPKSIPHENNTRRG